MSAFKEYLDELASLPERDLQQSAEKLFAVEKQHMARVIAHLAEISRRKSYLELGHSSLFYYCTQRLGLGEGPAYLRMQVASCCRRFPQILDALGKNELSLTVAGRIAPHLAQNGQRRHRLGRPRGEPATGHGRFRLRSGIAFSPGLATNASIAAAMAPAAEHGRGSRSTTDSPSPGEVPTTSRICERSVGHTIFCAPRRTLGRSSFATRFVRHGTEHEHGLRGGRRQTTVIPSPCSSSLETGLLCEGPGEGHLP